MNWPLSPDATLLLSAILLFLGAVLLITLILVLWVIWWVRRIDLPPGADFMTALRATPLIVVVVLDLLDLTLDVFSAPITWFFLSRLGLSPLRAVAVIKDLVPLTNWLPLMTLSWLYVHYVATGDKLFPMERMPRLHR